MNNDEPYTLLIGIEAEWYDEGMIAWDDGFDLKDCPYSEDTEPRAFWMKGYFDALDEGK
jgi:hypothetical protein